MREGTRTFVIILMHMISASYDIFKAKGYEEALKQQYKHCADAEKELKKDWRLLLNFTFVGCDANDIPVPELIDAHIDLRAFTHRGSMERNRNVSCQISMCYRIFEVVLKEDTFCIMHDHHLNLRVLGRGG